MKESIELEERRAALRASLGVMSERMNQIVELWDSIFPVKIKDLDRHPEKYPAVGELKQMLQAVARVFNEENWLVFSIGLKNSDEAGRLWHQLMNDIAHTQGRLRAFMGERHVGMRRDSFKSALNSTIPQLKETWGMFEQFLKGS